MHQCCWRKKVPGHPRLQWLLVEGTSQYTHPSSRVCAVAMCADMVAWSLTT